MIKRLAQVCGASAVLWSLGAGLLAVLYEPPTLQAQTTCWVCVCEGSRCFCQQVACPD